jgi:hypothetical protein
VYLKLQEIAGNLYNLSQNAQEKNLFLDADILEIRAAKIFEEAENISALLMEYENGNA